MGSNTHGLIWKEIVFSHKEALLSGDEYSVLPDYSWETLSLSKLIVVTFLLNANVLQVKSITFPPSNSVNGISLGFLHGIKSLKPAFWCQQKSNNFSIITQFWTSFPTAFIGVSDTGKSGFNFLPIFFCHLMLIKMTWPGCKFRNTTFHLQINQL